MARPREWDREALSEALTQYIESTDIPTVAGFAYSHGITRERLYEWPELSYGLKALIAKKEDALERGALSGNVNCSMAIFSLKQLGWSDRIDQTLRGDAKAPVAISHTDGAL